MILLNQLIHFQFFKTAFDTVAGFVQNLDQEWFEGDLHLKKMVQYLVFPKSISYTKDEGFGTAPKSLLFELTGQSVGKKLGMG